MPLHGLAGVRTANSQQPAPQGQGTNSLTMGMGIILKGPGKKKQVSQPVSACSIR